MNVADETKCVNCDRTVAIGQCESYIALDALLDACDGHRGRAILRRREAIGDCESRSVDWRARALAAEAERDEAVWIIGYALDEVVQHDDDNPGIGEMMRQFLARVGKGGAK